MPKHLWHDTRNSDTGWYCKDPGIAYYKYRKDKVEKNTSWAFLWHRDLREKHTGEGDKQNHESRPASRVQVRLYHVLHDEGGATWQSSTTPQWEAMATLGQRPLRAPEPLEVGERRGPVGADSTVAPSHPYCSQAFFWHQVLEGMPPTTRWRNRPLEGRILFLQAQNSQAWPSI
jgi:hypothetical protein